MLKKNRRVTFIDLTLPKQIFFDGANKNGTMRSSYTDSNQAAQSHVGGGSRATPIRPRQNTEIFEKNGAINTISTSQEEYGTKQGQRFPASRPRTSDLWRVSSF